MRLLIVALAIVAIAIGLLVWSGTLQGEDPAVELNDNAQDRFEVDSGMASESGAVPSSPTANDTQEGP